MQINANIKFIRELSGKKQAVFAGLIKTNVSNLKTYENTDVRPKANVLAAIANIAGVTIKDLESKLLTDKDIKFNWRKDEKDDVPPGNNFTDNPSVTKNPGEPGQASEVALLRQIIGLKDQIISMQSKENTGLQAEIGVLKETITRIDAKVDGCNRLIVESNNLSKEANLLMVENNQFLKQLEGLAELAKVARNQDSSETQDLKDGRKKQDGKGSQVKGK
jgi:transcriptional regulator with XRE-family HTH domain